jgi:DNA primase
MTTVHRVEDLKSLVDPLLVYQDYVRLTRRGRRSLGLCPFHKEKTPSFSVDGDNGLFYCFGCHRGGDVIKFLMEVEGCSFLEAAEILARKAGVRLETRAPAEGSRGTPDRRERLFKLLAAASRFYRQAFAEASPQSAVRAYARRRGIGPETAERLRLGFAPPEGGLLAHLARQEFTPAEALEAGLLVERARGEYAERFRNRLLFPIEDTLGRTVGFGGRALGDEEPKYLNSPESPVFQKRDLLYGLALTRQAVREAGRILLVEGYMDFLAAFQAGVPYVAATLGTALAEGQVRLVKRYAREVVLNFDRDAAGLQAAERAILLLLGEGLRIRVALVPSGKDPDGFIAAEGPEAYRRVVETAVPFFDFLVERALSSGSLQEVEGRMAFVDRLAAYLSAVPDPLERQEYLREVAARTGMEPALLRKRLQEPAEGGPAAPQGRSPDLPAVPVREQLLVKGVFAYPEAARRILADLPGEALDSAAAGPLLKELLAGSVEDPDNQALLARILNGCHEVPSEGDLKRAAAEVQVEFLRRKERELARQIREASRRADLNLVQILNREKMALLEEIGALMD